MTPAATLNKPQQARSQATLDRISRAAKGLIEERDWKDITMSEIAKEARSSVGSLYARFESKQALLDYLDEDYARSLIAFCQQHNAGFARQHPSLADFVQTLALDLANFYAQSPGLIRTLVMEARAHRPASFSERTKRMNETAIALYDAFNVFADDIAHPDTCGAISWAVFMLWIQTRERLIFPESVPAPGHDELDDIAQAVAHTVISYLTTAPQPNAQITA